MRPVAIVIPTAQIYDAGVTGRQARETAGIPTALIVSPDPDATGFTQTVNRGLAQVPDDHDVLILNDDVNGFTPGWLAELRIAMYDREDIGLIGPSGDCSTDPMRFWQAGDTGMVSVIHYPFWCALIRREALEDVGLLDERYIHYASDYDYCDRLREHGWAVVWLKDIVMHHVTAGSGRRAAWAGHDLSLYQRDKKRKQRAGTWLDQPVSLS